LLGGIKMSQKTAVSPDFFNLSGPSAIRKHFFPRQRLHVTDIAPFIGLCRARIYKRVKEGKLNLCIQYDEVGLPFITLDDLVEYLYPSASLAPSSPPTQPEPVRKVGRPRKTVTNELEEAPPDRGSSPDRPVRRRGRPRKTVTPDGQEGGAK